ncbi:MAG TPA: ABC transporter substrate-binding protein [Thermomicrobiales bacterium]|jgi:peptide/nickel transport system substrate-binding protein
MTGHVSPAVNRLMADAARGRLSRRQLIGRGLALGLSVPTITTLLAMHPGRALAAGGGTLKIGYDAEIQFLDPQKLQSGQDLLPSTLIFGRLTSWDATMLDPQPDIAESWTVSDDGLTYVFKLRSGVKFHSGRELTADDVVFSYQRALDIGPKGRGAGELREVDSFSATGPLEFTVKLKQTSAVFLPSTGHWALCIVDKDVVDKIDTAPAGTGPFTFVEWVPDEHVTYKKFDGYWNADKLAGWPDEVTSTPILEAVTRIANLQSGDIDLAANIPTQFVSQIEGDSNLQLFRQPYTAAYWTIAFNVTKPPFDNVKLRHAVARAIDKDAIHKNVFYNSGEVGCGLIPSGHWAYDPTIQCDGRDVDAAKALMQEAGVDQGLKVTFKFDSAIPESQPIGEILKQNLADIGIDVTLQAMEDALYLQEVWTDKNYEITDAEYTREPDPDALMQSVLRKDGGNNVMGYFNQQIEDLFDQGKATLDQEARKPIYSQIIKIMLQDMPLVKLQTVDIVWGGNKKVQGLQLWPKGYPNWLEYTFDPNA